MRRLKVLIDTNILIDHVAEREPFSEISTEVIQLCANDSIQGFTAIHSYLNMFFILRKHIPDIKERRDKLLDVAELFTLVEIDGEMILKSLRNNSFADFEDCVQAECAKKVDADYIVTRNVKDFAHSVVPAITPEELLKEMK